VKQSKGKARNPVAKALISPKYRQQRTVNRVKYTRKNAPKYK